MTRLQPNRRRGSTLAEAAMVILVFAVIVLGMIDLGVGVYRRNVLAQAARMGARQAITHGSRAPSGWNGGPWGPTAISQPATNTGVPIVAVVRPMLGACDLPNTTVGVEWPDGGNAIDQRVRVTMSTPYRPILSAFLGNQTITLTASSTMTIAH